MTDTRFTPGPWEARAWGQGSAGFDAYVVVDDGVDVVARVRCYTARTLHRKPFEANAHLIAAAPDMYAACETVFWIMKKAEWRNAHGLSEKESQALEALSAALAKARGEGK